MTNIITNENGVVWVETEEGRTLGFVNAFEVLDEDGLKYSGSVQDVADCDLEIIQDYENGAMIICVDDDTVVLTATEAKHVVHGSQDDHAKSFKAAYEMQN